MSQSTFRDIVQVALPPVWHGAGFRKAFQTEASPAMISVDTYSASQHKTAHEVLDILDRMDSRMEQHYSHLRSHPRSSFRGVVNLCIPDPDQPVLKPGEGLTTRVWARCISSSGLSFISPDEVETKALLVGIEIPEQETTWFQAEIKRERRMPDESFWEYGVAFINRIKF